MFEWDEENIRHIARHGVTPEEAEQALWNDPTEAFEHEENGEQRFSQVGITDAHRCLVVVTTWRGDLLRVVTAYSATRTDIKFYLERRRKQ